MTTEKRTLAMLDIIAVEVGNSNHGDFLKSLARAYQLADPQHKRMLRQLWYQICLNYRLFEEYADEIKEHKGEYMK